ncbi:MAG: DNA polymerase IV [Bacteroidota bacterium]
MNPPAEQPTLRKIIHVDMDAFYASVEQRDQPELRGKPVAVGGSSRRGVVMTASYEARPFGVRSAMPSVKAARLCPDLIFVPPRFAVYQEASRHVREIFFRFTDLVEPLSLDEAYLDVTENKMDIQSAIKVAKEIKRLIQAETGLTASAGVSINKFLAKIASGINKPDGLTFIPPERALEFLDQLPIGKFHGIGSKTADKMKAWGIHSGADLREKSEKELVRKFGKMGRHYFRIVNALDERPVKPNRIRKSVGAERTFSDDLSTPEPMMEKLRLIAEKVASRLRQNELAGRTLTLKIKHHDFTQNTRSRTVGTWLQEEEELYQLAIELLHHPALPEKPVRLLGISLSSLNNGSDAPYPGKQLTLF